MLIDTTLLRNKLQTAEQAEARQRAGVSNTTTVLQKYAELEDVLNMIEELAGQHNAAVQFGKGV